ncbi:GNAT family N-acetyltransferase [Streptomyces sp. NPDC004237]|uniref:GNAT family N-acetyltransferase n=1 Tax=Streptomyces sp. NPDC004237 TaxID=3154455 RepID=UPI0033B5BDEE
MTGTAHSLAARMPTTAPAGSCHDHRRHSPRRDAVTVHTVEGSAALAWLEQRWPTIYGTDPAATPFASPGWLLGWASQLPASATPLLLLATGRFGVHGALALLREDHDHGTALRTMSPYCEYVTVVGPGAQDHHVADALASRLSGLARAGAVVTLANLPARSPLAMALRRQPGWRHTTSRTAAVPLPLDLTALSKSTRRQHTRREQALAGSGRVTYRRTRTAAGLLDALPALVSLYDAQRQAEVASTSGAWGAVLSRCADSAFIAEVTADGGAVMASQLCLYRNGHCYSVLPAMDLAMSRLAPGHALLRWLAADLADDGFAFLDLGPTRETPGQVHYKAQYGPIWDVNLTSTAGGASAPHRRPGSGGTAHDAPGPAPLLASLTKDGTA